MSGVEVTAGAFRLRCAGGRRRTAGPRSRAGPLDVFVERLRVENLVARIGPRGVGLALPGEEGGCTDAALLDHLRGEESHALGCWPLDAVLGKA